MTITTKCGNQYSEIEWAEMMSNWDLDIAEVLDAMEKEDIIKEIAAQRLVNEAGVDEAKSYLIVCHIYDYTSADIQFSSVEKKEAVERIDRWMTEQAASIF